MNKNIAKIIFLTLVLITGAVNAQNFQGQAFYKSKTSMDDSFKIEGTGISEEMKKELMENMKKQLEKEYVLTFNKTESIFTEEQKLDAPKPSSGGFEIRMENSSDGKLYKNIKNKVSVTEEEFFGKEFLITDSISTYNWKIEGESKKIGDYTCYKATFTIPVSQQEKDEYEKFLSKKSDDKTQLLMMDEPKERPVIVWYTPEIPVSHGPAEYWGLPGLILEASFDKTVILCSKVIINPKDKLEIKVPNKGKKVTNAEFHRLVEEQMEQMNNQHDGRDGGVRIEIHR